MAFTFWDWTILLVTVLGATYIYAKWHYGYFRRHGIKCIKPSVPFVGNMWKLLTKQESFIDLMIKTYNAFPDEKYVGYFELTNHLIMVRDVNLIKQIAVKDFDHFTDHRSFASNVSDKLFGRHLFAMKGQEWRDMRSTLSPAFTGSKMKMMFSLVVECAEQLTDYYQKKLKEPNNQDKGLLEIEMKNTFTRYASDVIATCAFGVKVNSLEDETNEFYNMGKKATNFTGLQLLKFLLVAMVPKLMKFLGIQFMDPRVSQFFRQQIQGQMKEREETGYFRQDMINLLMEAKKGSLMHEKVNENEDVGFATVEESKLGQETHKRVWTDDDLTAQALLFFVAGFDTSSTFLSFFSHEMVANLDIQKRLQEEIDETNENLNGKLAYSDIQKMKYLDMVVSETLRFWPPAIATDRLCIKPYKLPPPTDSGVPYQLNFKDGIWIPIRAIHHDPQYFKNPEKFDPERFSDENKSSINQYAYLPFGIGPRNCIGSRFALMEVKAIIFYMLLKFDFVPASKTQIPFKLAKGGVTMTAENGFWVGLKTRTN